MKQAAKMQKKMQELQDKLAEEVIEVQAGGGAISIRITLGQEVRAITLDEEFLKEDKAFVEETLLEGVRAAFEQSKAKSEAAMNEIAEGMRIPGMPSLF